MVLVKDQLFELFQRSKGKWLKNGDVNTFLHVSVKSKSKRNVILSLKIDDVWL